MLNSPFMRWLLDVERIPADAEALRLTWERGWPGWAWLLAALAAAAFAVWTYSRLTGPRGGRITMAAVRFVVIMLVLVLLSGPMLELPRESVERDWVLMLVDRSESMTIADAPDDDGSRRITRDEQVGEALAEHDHVWADLAEQREVVWLGFHLGAFDLASDAAPEAPDAGNEPRTAALDLGEPAGGQTRLNTALEQALQRAAARPLSGVVVFSDGRTIDPPDRSILRRLQADAVPVHVVPLGSPDPVGDLAVRRVEAPRRAFIRDKVPVVVGLDRLGTLPDDTSVRLRLVDEQAGETLDEQTVAPGEDLDDVTLTATPQLAGEAVWQVVLDAPDADLIPENNLASFSIDLIDRPLTVLFIEGYPRWEYRYLKNLMIREASIESSVMLISADRDFAQEGNVPIARLPRTPEELAAYDVIVLGDVPAGFFTSQQLETIRNHVAERGAGLLWIAGPRSTPETYAGTALADLLPMRGSLALPTFDEPVNMTPTPLAEQLGVLQLVSGSEVGWPSELADPTYGWSQLVWAQRIEPARLKPTAEMLAQTARPVDGGHPPLVLHLRYGAGQSIYVATDEIWRWRYGRGELLPEQFWLQMIRMLARESLGGADVAATLDVEPRRVQVGRPVRLDVRLLDAQLIDPRRVTVKAVVEQAEDGEPVAEVDLRRLEGAEARYATTILADTVGLLNVRIDDPTLPEVRLQTDLEVFAPDDELRRPETDHELLASLAAATGGQVLDPANLEALGEETSGLLRNRAVRTSHPLRERIWDTPLFFALILALLTLEWVGRKAMRLI